MTSIAPTILVLAVNTPYKMLLQRHGEEPAPYNVISLDSEDSDGITYIWAVAGHYNGREVRRLFDNRRDVVRYLFNRRWPHTVLTGVNLGYDLNTLIYKGGFMWDILYNMGSLITARPRKSDITKYKLGGHYLKIVELGNWILNTSLAGMCKQFGIEGHIDKHVLGRDGDKDEMIEACMSHARCGALAYDYIQGQGQAIHARMKLTSSSTSLDTFLLHYLKKEHQIFDFKGDFEPRFYGWGGLTETPYNTADDIEKARLAKLDHLKQLGGMTYVGGRCEAFNLGHYNKQGGIDINSSYPRAMRDEIYPDMNTYRRVFTAPDELEYLMKRYEGAAHVKVRAPYMRIPLLHYKSNGKLIFPIGDFTGWYTFVELRRALELGYEVLSVYEAALFEGIKGLFTDYINDMYRLKEQDSTKYMSKLLMNGLSGKFGQRKHGTIGFNIYDMADLDNIVVDNKRFFCFHDIIYEYTPDNEPVDYVNTAYPLISAYVTAYGREDLFNTAQDIGEEYVKYSDTDSIHADYEPLCDAIDAGLIEIHDTKLGAWSWEYHDTVLDIRGLKYYRYKAPNDIKKDDNDNLAWQYKIKGVRHSDQPSYWHNRRLWSHRVRKIRSAIRGRKRINEFYDIFRTDRLESPKRIYNRRDSEPFTIMA